MHALISEISRANAKAGNQVQDHLILQAAETIAISDSSPQRGWCAGLQPNYEKQNLGHANSLRQAFPDLIPLKPFCADLLSDGLKIRGKKSALKHRHIQLNGPTTFMWMPHDIDHSGAYFAHRDANIPEPNVIAINPENGHAHCAVLLTTPIARHSAARIRPLRFYGAVERGIARRIGADRQYSGLISKNPLHADWKVEWRRPEPYTLHELADWLFYEDMRPDTSVETTFGVGRNCAVFDELRRIAYREVRAFKRDGSIETFRARLERAALDINMQFPQPLRFGDIRATAKSVAGWTWRHFSEQQFSRLQSLRGARRSAQMWAGHISREKTRPWGAEGISRATWYRRRRPGGTISPSTLPGPAKVAPAAVDAGSRCQTASSTATTPSRASSKGGNLPNDFENRDTK
jgi:hypothetical protein